MIEDQNQTKDRENGEQLNEDRIRKIAQEETSVRSPDGKTVRLADLIASGLDKKQAIGALGLIALGSGVGAAITIATSSSVKAVSVSTGSGEISAAEIEANELTTGELSVEEISGDLVGSDPIENLDGNLYVSDSEPNDPVEDDIWIDTSEL